MYVGIVLLVLAWVAVRTFYRGAPWPRPPAFTAPGLMPACAGAVVLVFIAELLVIDYVARHQVASPCFLHLAVPVVADFSSGGGPAMPFTSALLAAFAVVQTLLLACAYFAHQSRAPKRWEWMTTAAAIALGLGAAVWAPAMTSPDPLMYFSFAKIGFGSFAASTHVVRLPNFSAISCEKALLPSAYGPAFIAYAGVLLGRIHDPAVAVSTLRATNALWLLACIPLLRRANVPWILVVLLLLDPPVLFQYVGNAHNDIIALVLVLAAFACADASLVAGIALVTLAGLFKLPFAAIGALAFAARPPAWQRLGAACAGVLLALFLSYAWAGPRYFEGLAYYHRLLDATGNPFDVALSVVALAAIVAAVVRRSYAGAASFSFPGLAVAEIQPWYALWGLPYALRERRHLALWVVLLPVAAFLMDDSVSRGAQLAIYAIAVIAIGAFVLRDVAYSSKPHERASS